MHRGENAVRGHAMRGPEPRAPELEIPRVSAGVGAQFSGLSSSLVFELGVCPECLSRLVESNGLLVCENCGLVASPVYEAPKIELDGSAPIAASLNPARGARGLKQELWKGFLPLTRACARGACEA